MFRSLTVKHVKRDGELVLASSLGLALLVLAPSRLDQGRSLGLALLALAPSSVQLMVEGKDAPNACSTQSGNAWINQLKLPKQKEKKLHELLAHSSELYKSLSDEAPPTPLNFCSLALDLKALVSRARPRRCLTNPCRA